MSEESMNEPNPSILIVDDEVDTCQNLADILNDLGYHVDTAHNGHDALGLVDQNYYDVALLDLKMPGMDGVELYRRIKQRRAGTVAIIVTAYASSETAEAALQAGAWQILSKPVDMDMLMEQVQAVLDQPLVLVVDDDHDLCENLWDLLREREYRVCLAHNAQEAAQRIGERDYDVMLLDLKLPEGNGGKLFRKVRQDDPQTRVILITGYRSEMGQMIDDALQDGADAVCYKPFDVPKLLETIGRSAGLNEQN